MDFIDFIKAVAAHWFWWIGLVLTLEPMYQHLLPAKWQKWIGGKMSELAPQWFLCTGVLLVLIAFYQSWQDEHRIVAQLIVEKSGIVREREFWKNQSFQKDASLRIRDELLGKNVSALSDTQTSLASLSNRLLDIGKPERLNISIDQVGSLPPIRPGYTVVQYLIIPNRLIAAKGLFYCDCQMADIHAWVAGTANLYVGGHNGGVMLVNQGRGAQVDIMHPAMSPTAPLIISFNIADPKQIHQVGFRAY
jgi:hypothetical protein